MYSRTWNKQISNEVKYIYSYWVNETDKKAHLSRYIFGGFLEVVYKNVFNLSLDMDKNVSESHGLGLK